MAYSAIQEASKEKAAYEKGINILKWCSVLDPDYINSPLIIRLTGYNRSELNDGMEILKQYSLLSRNGDFISIAEIVQCLVQIRMGGDWLAKSIRFLGDILEEEFSPLVMTSYNISRKSDLIMHAQWILLYFHANEILEPSTVALLHGTIGEYKLKLGDFVQAEDHLKMALEIGNRQNPDDMASAVSALSMAFLYEAEGKYKKAFETLEYADEWKKVIKDRYPVRYLQWKELEAYLYEDSMLTEEAREASDEALSMLESCLPLVSQEQAVTLRMELVNIKGQVFVMEGRDRDAADMFVEVLEIGKKEFENNESRIPAYVWAKGNLAHTQMNLKKQVNQNFLEQEKDMKQLYKNTLHPDMAFQKYSQGWYYYKEGGKDACEQAAHCFSEALAILDQLQFYEHPLAAMIYLLYSQNCIINGQYEEAYEHSVRGLRVSEKMMDSRVKERLEMLLLTQAGHAQTLLLNAVSAGFYLKQAKKCLRNMKGIEAIKSALYIQMYFFLLGCLKLAFFLKRIVNYIKK